MGGSDTASTRSCSLDEWKSPNDKNSYRLLTLANEMEALLVSSSDEGKQKAACAVCVQVGSFSDPAGRCEGLAHYCEHMLFMGSGLFPGESEFEEFLSENGGYSNAFTECEYTCYYFEVNRKALDKALHMFAELFHEPLFTPDSSSRELQAIESEFQKKRHNDSARSETLFASFAKCGHPWKLFGWGNLQSLKEEPELQGISLQDELRSFFACHYKPNRMRMCVFSVEALDSLQEKVDQRFSVIAASPCTEQLDFAARGLPFELEKLPRLVRIRPVRDVHELSLSWQSPSLLAHYLSKPQQYLSHLIGDEGHGSILSFLKDKGLATELSAGSDGDNFSHSTNSMIFNVEITLTERGMQEWPLVTKVVFQYINMLRQNDADGSLPPWPFEEKRLVAEMTFRFLQEKDPCDLVQELSGRMLPFYQHKVEHLLTGPWRYDKFRQDVISSILKDLTVHKCFITISSSSYGRASGIAAAESSDEGEDSGPDDEDVDGGATTELVANTEHISSDEADSKRQRIDQDHMFPAMAQLDPLFDAVAEFSTMCVEPRFGTEYWETEVDVDLIRAWEECELNPQIHVHEPNSFIASDFTFPPPEHSESDNGEIIPAFHKESGYSSFPLPPQPRWPVPRQLNPTRTAPGMILWHLGCADRFQQPRSEVWMKITAPHYALDHKNVQKEVLLDWYVSCLQDSLNEVIYPASIARLHCSVVSASHGISFKLGGFSQKLLAFVEKVLLDMRLEHFLSRASLRVQAQKEELMRNHKNAWLKPASHCAQLRRLLLLPAFMRPSAQEKHLSAASVQDLRTFIDSFHATLGCETLVTGNTSSAELLRWVDVQGTVARLINPKPQPLIDHEVVRLEPGTATVLMEPAVDASQPNSAIEIYWQIPGRDPSEWDEARTRLKVVLDLLEDIMYEPLFDELRTKQQLGYSVSCSSRHSHGVLGFSIYVLSAVQRPPFLLQRIEAFVAQFSALLRGFSADKFSSHVKSLASRWLEPVRTLSALQSLCWSELLSGYPAFDRYEREAALLGTVKQDDICELLDSYLSASAPSRACIITAVAPKSPSDTNATTGDGGGVDSFEQEFETLRSVAASTAASATVRRVCDEREFHLSARLHEPRQ